MLLVITPSAIAGAPLCRDLKGLYTPCIGSEPAVRRYRDKQAAERQQQADEDNAEQADATPNDPTAPRRHKVHATHAAKPERVGPFTVGKLCRDGKGLFTPCPH